MDSTVLPGADSAVSTARPVAASRGAAKCGLLARWADRATVLDVAVDAETFRGIFDAHFPAVRRYVARRCTAGEVDDVVAEVFTIAWRRRDLLPDQPLGWLLATARRVLANLYRAQARRNLLTSKLSLISLPAVHQTMAEQCLDPELRTALEVLSPRDREVLLLSVWEGLSGTEIAEVTDSSVNAVHIRLSRARRRLLQALDPPSGTPTRDANRPVSLAPVTGFGPTRHSTDGEP